MENELKERVIIYLRVSTSDQSETNQLKDCMSICKWDNPIILRDRDSAWSSVNKRDGYKELIRRIKKGGISHLILWDFDRAHRNRLRFKEFLVFLKAFGVKLHSYRQMWIEDLNKIPTPWNEIMYDLMINIYGHIAEDESNKKSERIKIAIRKKCPKCGKVNPGSSEKCEACGTSIIKAVKISYKGNVWGKKALNKRIKKWIIRLHKEGKSYSEIMKEVFYWDKNRKKKFVCKGLISKVVSKYERIKAKREREAQDESKENN